MCGGINIMEYAGILLLMGIVTDTECHKTICKDNTLSIIHVMNIDTIMLYVYIGDISTKFDENQYQNKIVSAVFRQQVLTHNVEMSS